MKIFLDANVLVSVVNREYPLFSLSSRILSLSDQPQYEIFTSPLCLGITFYFAEKKSGNKSALAKLKLLSSKLSISTMDEKVISQTVSNQKIHDFEDGMEYYAAKDSGCELIITEDVSDFYFSDLKVLNCEGFLKEL